MKAVRCYLFALAASALFAALHVDATTPPDSRLAGITAGAIEPNPLPVPARGECINNTNCKNCGADSIVGGETICTNNLPLGYCDWNNAGLCSEGPTGNCTGCVKCTPGTGCKQGCNPVGGTNGYKQCTAGNPGP